MLELDNVGCFGRTERRAGAGNFLTDLMIATTTKKRGQGLTIHDFQSESPVDLDGGIFFMSRLKCE